MQTDAIRYMMPWDKFFKRSIIQKYNIRFDEHLSLGEDRLFCYHYMLYCRGIVCYPYITYIHDASNINSLTYRKYPSEVNEYKYKVFKAATKALIREFSFKEECLKSLNEYLDNVYTSLINAYRSEGNFFAYIRARILHKLGIL